MCDSEQFIKEEIINYFKQQDRRDDHVLDLKQFAETRMIHWPPKHKQLLEPTLVKLIKEGMLAKDEGYIILASKGLDLVYCFI